MNENSCGNPMQAMAQMLCATGPTQCSQLWDVYQYMGHTWQNDSTCGAEQNSWCSVGATISRTKFTLCVEQ